MGFFSAVGQVVSNQKNFRQWEKEDSNKQKQREALAQKGIKQAELQKAANKGKVIMDVIDIMDTHSEEVAENTETAIMPLAQSIPALGGIITLFGTLKLYTQPAGKAYDNGIKTFNKSQQGKETVELLSKLQENIKNAPANSPLNKIKLGEIDFLTNLHGTKLKDIDIQNTAKYSPSTIFSKSNMKILANSSDDNIKNIHSKLSELAKEFHNSRGIKNNSFGKMMGKTFGIMALVEGAIFIAANIAAAKIQVKSSRIARWQSREDLKDPKYFVQYTDEQIKEAKNNLEANKEENPGKKKKNNLSRAFKYTDNNSFFKSLGATIKDNKNYEEWKANYNLDDKKVKRNLTPAELKEAEKEQEVIQRITKIINNKAEEYSENMETTAGVLIGGTPFLGLGIGALINTIVTKTGLGERISNRNFEKLLKQVQDNDKKEELRSLFNKIKTETKDKADKSLINSFDKANNFKEYFTKILNATNTFENKEGFSAVFASAKDMFNVAMTTKAARNAMVGFAGTIITGTVGAFIGLKLQKSAARAGRYKAKRELEENKENFIGYTKEDFKSVDNIKAEKKGALQKLGGYLTFIPRVLKDYFNYEKYKKTTADYDKALLNELTKVNVTDKQLQEARELQRKLFTTFESVDDKSQEYSEAIEAVSEMSQPVLPYIGMLLASIPLLIKGKKVIKGGGVGITESITGFFAKHTKFLKGKAANKYVDGVAANIKTIIEKQNATDGAQKPFTKFFNFLPDEFKGLNVPEAIKNAAKTAQGSDNEFKAFLYAFADNPAFKTPIDKANTLTKIDDFIQNLTKIIDETSKGETGIKLDAKEIEELKAFLIENTKNANNISDIFKAAMARFDIPNIKISDMTKGLDSLKSMDLKGIGDYFKQGVKSNNIPGVANAVIEGKIQSGDWRKILEQQIKTMPDNNIRKMLNGILNSSMTDEQALKIYHNIQTILKNIPKEEFAKIIKISIEEYNKNPAKFMQALQSGQLKSIFVTKGVAAAAIAAPITWSAITMLITFAVESVFASMQKQAGRLGVMKALEELEDVRFYANMEPDSNNKQPEAKTASVSANSKGQRSVSDIFNALRQSN